jgi:hypothetical protein
MAEVHLPGHLFFRQGGVILGAHGRGDLLVLFPVKIDVLGFKGQLHGFLPFFLAGLGFRSMSGGSGTISESFYLIRRGRLSKEKNALECSWNFFRNRGKYQSMETLQSLFLYVKQNILYNPVAWGIGAVVLWIVGKAFLKALRGKDGDEE